MLDSIRRNSQSWVVKVIFALIIITFVFWGANTMSSESSDVLAVVNGENLYRNELIQDFNWEMQQLLQNNPQLSGLSRDEQEEMAIEILRRMISKALLRQEAIRLGLSVSDIELSAYVTAMPMFQDGTGKFSDSIYRDTISLMGLTPGTFEKMASDDVLMNKLQSYIGNAIDISEEEARRMFNFELERRVVDLIPFSHADYMDKIDPTEAEIITLYSETKEDWRIPTKVDIEFLNFDVAALSALTPISDEQVSEYYEANKERFVVPERFNTRHILIRMPLSLDNTEEAIATAKAKAEKVAAEIKAGKSFAEAAKEYSDDFGTKETGGNIGWVEKGQLEPAYEIAALALAPGEISEPVRSYYGFHIIELLDLRPEAPRSLEDTKSEILAQLQEDAAFTNLADAMANVEDAIITGSSFEDVASEYKVEIKDSGLMSPSSIQALLELPEDTFDNVANMTSGTVFPTMYEAGKGFMVLRLKDYKPTYIPEITEIHEDLVFTFKEEGAKKLARADAFDLLNTIHEAAGKVPAEYAPKVVSANSTRLTGIMAMGETPELTQAIYLASTGEWLAEPYSVNESTIIACVKETLPPEDSYWQEISAQYVQGINASRKNDLFNLFLSELHKKANIKIKAEYLLYPN